MASISQSLGILRSSGLAAANSYAVVNALSIINKVFNTEVPVEVFLKDLRFPVICQQAGVIGALLPYAINADDKVDYSFFPLVKAAFKLISPTLKTTKEDTKYVALEYIGQLPHPLQEAEEGEDPVESAVPLPNLLVAGKNFAMVNSAWEFESSTASEVFLSPISISTNGLFSVSRISPIKTGGAHIELADAVTIRVSEKSLDILAVGTKVDVVDGVAKVGQTQISMGTLSDLYNFQYKVGLVFVAESLEKIGKKALKFTSDGVEYWAPNSLKKKYAALAPNYPEEILCEVISENEKDGKMYPQLDTIFPGNNKYAVKKELATLLVPVKN